MNLFDILPENYFSLFSGKNRQIYIESLLTLYSLIESDETLISRGDFVSTLKEKGSALDSFSYDDEEEMEFIKENGDEALLQNTLASKAAFIVRRLEETGWINLAVNPDNLEETIVLPQYSMVILKAFSDIISDEEAPYLSLVHSTYSELKLEDEEQDELMYATVLRSYENTGKLKVELITLTHSIRIFQTKLSRLFDTNRVLHDYFDIYKKKIVDRYYHPLKTFDSVARFKRPIIKILEKWLAKKEIRDKLVAQGSIGNSLKSKSEIEKDIIAKINYITDTYEKLYSIVSDIDEENNKYTRSSTNKILYLNNNDKTIKGHLDNIFKNYAKSINDPRKLSKILSKMQDSIYFYEQGYLDSNSVTLPILRRKMLEGVPMELVSFDDYEGLMDDFLESASLMFSDDKVYSFMEEAFNGKDEINIEEVPLRTFDDFICLILAVIKKNDENCFYNVVEINKQKIHTQGYIVPNFKFIKKE